MSIQHARQFSRRRFLGGLTLAGTAGLLGLHLWPGRRRAATRDDTPATDVDYGASVGRPNILPKSSCTAKASPRCTTSRSGGEGRQTRSLLASGQVDLSMQFVGPSLLEVDAGNPISLVAGVQIGCWELFGTDQVRTIRDLKGKAVAADGLGDSRSYLPREHAGLRRHGPPHGHHLGHAARDPGGAEAKQLFVEGKVDAFLATPPLAQELAGQKDRVRVGEHDDGSALVPVLLLYAHGP